ncbi:MAG: glycosyltransferase, partial [Clostridia bacterium]|nr:glycosyltransferase [Clostridia bacterium]
LYKSMYGKDYPVYTDKNYELMSESAGVKNFAKEKILDRFVNSFLVTASKEEIEEKEKILYVKLNQGRKKEFRILTKIVEQDGSVDVKKAAMCPEAVSFVKSLVSLGEQKLSGNYENLPCVYGENEVSYPFLTGETLQHKMKDYAQEDNIQAVEESLRRFYETYFVDRKKAAGYQNEEFCKVFGDYPGKEYYECVSPANVDLICANIFVGGSEDKIIDYEWVFPFEVPVAFIMWRMIHELYTQIPKLNTLCTEELMMEKFGIEYSDCEIFMKWTMHFVYEYVGSDPLDAYRKPRLHVDLQKLAAETNGKKVMQAKLYYDLGSGMNEADTMQQQVMLDRERFTVTFDLSKLQGVRAIRWNPAQGQMCQVKVESLDCGEKAELLPWGYHIQKDEQTTVFLTKDPYYFIQAWDPAKVQKITIRGSIHYLEMDDIDRLTREEMERQQRQAAEQAVKDAKEARERERQRQLQEAEAALEAQRIAAQGKKAKLKRVIKKVIGREEQPVVSVAEQPKRSATCVGSADQFAYVNNDLNVAGWAFDTEYKMSEPHIAFYKGDEKVGEFNYFVIFRWDVAEVLKNPEAESCGFAFMAEVQTPVDLKMYLEYDTEVGPGKFLLGTVPGNKAKSPDDEILIFPTEDVKSLGNIRYFELKRVRKEKYIYPPVISQETIDIIIPVYNGLEYFDALFSSIEKTRMSYRLIIVDDKSPDVRVREYLDQYAAAHSNVVLLRNEENMGFLPSVNRALAMAEHHVALVNTDVEVPAGWLERLMLPILTKEKVASSTPFTTCGTICSFPNFCEDNEIFEGMKLREIDDVFDKIKPQYPVMPTGIGFCMGMNLDAIREVGLLDAETFGKGYGEENDWCQRAIKAGYENV